MEESKFKIVSFDLDTKELKKYFPTNSWNNAYYIIREHMENEGFKWIQGSFYQSNNQLLTQDVLIAIETLVGENEWLHKCMRDCRVGNIEGLNDLGFLFDNTKDIPEREIKKSKDSGLSL